VRYRDLERDLISILSASPEVGAALSEARLIIFYVLKNHGFNPEHLTNLSLPLEALDADGFLKLTEEALNLADSRRSGRLLQHLLGKQYFLNHEYSVSPAVLIPRPETEILATHTVDWARRVSTQRPLRFAELGLGSGVLSCELLSGVPAASGVASEASPDAITLARTNLSRIVGSDYESRLQILQVSNAMSGFEVFLPHSPFDLIVSNPPYVAPDDPIEAQVIREEPHAALFAAGPVNHFYESFALHGRSLLATGGKAAFEIPHERHSEITALFEHAGFRVECLPDLTGRPRVLILE